MSLGATALAFHKLIFQILNGDSHAIKKKKAYAKHFSVTPFVSKTRSGWKADLESTQIYKGDKALAIMTA